MPVNLLTTEVGLRVGPVVLETLVRHYIDRLKRDAQDEKSSTRLRQDELLYDQIFNVVKTFLYTASFHTVEDVQGFANTRTPSPPWVHVVRLVVPMSSCNDAAAHLVKVFGGEDEARRIVGGVKWWQVRGITGVDAQWITTKKDWQEAKRRYKMQGKHVGAKTNFAGATEPGAYEKEMDDMRCILYIHGGGYYFGSVDQERYSIQRHARKINGRVFAVNYRLAPQYPFPCALQDLLAAYLFLIRPPPDAAHCPVNPQHIVIAGDSAGGGASLSLLQIIRDADLPMPAGGVLISPWCDLTHSFPSIHTNTSTDIIPPWGLSLQKPSILWPPPSDGISDRVRASLKSRIRQVFHMQPHGHNPTVDITPSSEGTYPAAAPVDVGATSSPPPPEPHYSQTITLVARSGETLKIDEQVHLYTQNSLIPHPLVSPALSYLGGLPPLLIIASDKEVLRDEIIYTAHKAANPEKYPIKDEARALYPALQNIESRHQPTQVHLQVYDDTAHVLPVLFSFTTPAKFCFRAIATFCKHVTRMTVMSSSPPNTSFSTPNITPQRSFRRGESKTSTLSAKDTIQYPSSEPEHRKSLRRSLSRKIHKAASAIRPRSASGTRSGFTETRNHGLAPPLPNNGPHRENSNTSSDVGGPRFRGTPSPGAGERTAGDASVYSENWYCNGPMIRERVSTQGIIRPLEPDYELDAFGIPHEIVGLLSELSVRRYLDARAKFDKKFATTIKTIDKRRRQNLELAKSDTKRNMDALQNALMREENKTTNRGVAEGLMMSSESWSWAWALDEEERPPPSSIVSRRDTEEGRQLAKIAELHDDQSLSGNNFWSVVVNFLTVTPDTITPLSSGLHPLSI